MLDTTLHAWNSYDIARQITDAVRDGFAVKVNGYPVVGSFGRDPKVTSCGNGTLYFESPSKTKGKTRPVYVKVGERVVVTT